MYHSFIVMALLLLLLLLSHQPIGVILFIHPQKNAVLNLFLVNKQEKNKTAEVSHLFFFVFVFF